MGAMNDGMRNICELLINVVMLNRPKMLTGLDQNGKRYGWGVPLSLHVCPEDIYRKAQVLTLDGLKAKIENPDSAHKIYNALKETVWPRGRFFAKQNLAHLKSDWDTLLRGIIKINCLE